MYKYNCCTNNVLIYINFIDSFFARFEVVTVVRFEVKIFWVVMVCTAVVGSQCLRVPCVFHLQGVTTQKTST